ncbi:HAD domain-containing protein [Burkholderia pseudomallei]|uniref:HAD domain-containing protein n=1 Tax=Burkholderia pseudomallei TaxID=28450 RepID=UPI0027E0D238|nr:HAD domain-containing protein [Burkholderia pseudomallei]
MTTLFTDFDGVVHPADATTFDRAGRLVADPRLFAWLPVLADILAPYPAVRIVVSSDWRRWLDDDNLRRVLGPLAPRFAGVMETWGASRADEILEEVRRRRLTRWLALDDHPSVAKASVRDDRFIVCAPDSGLSAPAVQALLRARLAAMPC